MDKITNAITALKLASQELSDTMHVLSVSITEQNVRVHVNTLRDLEQVPGAVKCLDDGTDYLPITAHKFYAGAYFFTLLERDESPV